MDIIFIHDLQVKTVIGVDAEERCTRRTLWLDLELGADLGPAAASDALDDTLNYQAVAQRLVAFAATRQDRLVETLGMAMVELLQREFDPPWLRLTVRKPDAVATAREVGVIIERCRQEHHMESST